MIASPDRRPEADEFLRFLGPEAIARCILHIIRSDLATGSGGIQPAQGNIQRLISSTRGELRTSEVRLGDDGVGLDSLGRISGATAVARFFDLGVTGIDDYLLANDCLAEWVRLIERHFAQIGHDASIVFQTSGSTDAPRKVPRQLKELNAEVAALGKIRSVEGTRRIVGLCPPQHIFGFIFTCLLADHLSVPVIDASFRGAGSVMRELSPGDLVVGTPFHWTTLLGSGARFPEGVHGVTSGGAMPSATWEALENSGLRGLVEVFGSTETGGLGVRGAPDEAFSLLFHLVRSEDGVCFADLSGSVCLQDHLVWTDDCHFRPEGRLDRAVQIAGVNVSIARVRSVLCECELVRDASVRPSGDRLKAFVVPEQEDMPREDLLTAIEEHVRAHLDAVARPTSYEVGPSLPVNDMGKLSDW